MSRQDEQALHLITWSGSAEAGPGLVCTIDEVAIGVQQLKERGETDIRSTELLRFTDADVEVKLFRNGAGHFCVRVYDLEVGETVGVTDYASDFDAALYQFNLCTGVETAPSSFGVL